MVKKPLLYTVCGVPSPKLPKQKLVTRSVKKKFSYPLEDLKEVQIPIKNIFYLLQPFLAEGTHGVADHVETSATGENDEALQQGLTACNVLQLKLWNTRGKLENMGEKRLNAACWTTQL